jgi:serine-type D-Ala-D-Ala endopeptidase (penicillin-binding protein 7)
MLAVIAALLPLTFSVAERDRSGKPMLRSESVAVRFADTGEMLIEKNADFVRPIASVTKLLSGVVIEGMDKETTALVTIMDDDKDKKKWSKSRLVVGLVAPWLSLFHAALGASDNRAMFASVRALGVERQTFAQQMNKKAKELGMMKSAFVDPAGLDPLNVSTARDLLSLLQAASASPSIREATTLDSIDVGMEGSREVHLTNPNRLARSSRWRTIIGKTGYTVEAGRSLATRIEVGGRQVDLVFLGAREMASVFGDAGRIRRWLDDKFHLTEGTSVR